MRSQCLKECSLPLPATWQPRGAGAGETRDHSQVHFRAKQAAFGLPH